MARPKRGFLARLLQRVGAWLSRLFSRGHRRSQLKQPPISADEPITKRQQAQKKATAEIQQTVTGDCNVVVGKADSVTVDQSERAAKIDGNVKDSIVSTGDYNTNFNKVETGANVTVNHYGAALRTVGEVNPFGVPYSRNRYFTGREDVLLQLHEQLMQTNAIAMTQVRAIRGLGGIGKTQTAVEYAYRYYEGSLEKATEPATGATTELTEEQSQGQTPEPAAGYQYVFWVNADTQINLASSYAAIAEQLAVPNAQAMPQDQKITAVRSWLNRHNRWLLIFDNADNPDWLVPWMPTNPQGKVLITSRASVFDQLGIPKSIALDVLSEAAALTLLFERTRIARTDISESEAQQLNQELDGLPLALEQASAYILRQKIGFGRYLRAYRSRGLTQLEKEKAQTGRYPSSVLKTWQLNMAAVQEEEPAASALLEMSAFLAPDEIPCWLLKKGSEALGNLLGVYLEGEAGETTDEEEMALALRELLSLLSRYSLIRWHDDTPDTYSLHRLVQAVVQSQLDSQTAADWIEQVVAAISEADPGQEFEQWPLFEQLLPHWLSVIRQALSAGQRSATLGLLCNQAGFFLKSQGRYQEAEPLYLDALNIRKAELGERHPDTATSLNNLAGLYESQGRYQEAEPLLLDALNITKAELGERHPSTATSLNNLAELYRAQGRYQEAEPLLLDALNIRKAELGERHPSTATSLNNLAALYKSQGRYQEAEPLLLDALNIKRDVLGERHPSTASSLNNLAALYKSQGRYQDAEPLYLDALNIRKAELGERHPSTATSLNNLAALYASQGRYQEAEPLYLDALNIRKAELGERHPDTATSLNNLAALYASQGRYQEAEPWLTDKSLFIQDRRGYEQ